jgi:hypothetical protein
MPLRVIRRPDTGSLTICGRVRPAGEKTGIRIRQRAGSDDEAAAREEAAAIERKILHRHHNNGGALPAPPTVSVPKPEKASAKLDPQSILAMLQEGLGALSSDGWHVLIRATYRPRDGSGGGVTFTVGTEPASDEA